MEWSGSQLFECLSYLFLGIRYLRYLLKTYGENVELNVQSYTTLLIRSMYGVETVFLPYLTFFMIPTYIKVGSFSSEVGNVRSDQIRSGHIRSTYLNQDPPKWILTSKTA